MNDLNEKLLGGLKQKINGVLSQQKSTTMKKYLKVRLSDGEVLCTVWATEPPTSTDPTHHKYEEDMD